MIRPFFTRNQKKLKCFYIYISYNSVPDSHTSTMSIIIVQAAPAFRSRITHSGYSTKRLSDIIVELFDPTESRNLGTKLRYRIPAHQRFDSWSINQKKKLVDTILQDFIILPIIVTSHGDVTGIYYNIQDGQTRLTALHEFANNKFPAFDGRFFKDLSEEERVRFMTYQIDVKHIEKNRDTTEREFDEIIAEMFERLNSGKPLSDNDKFHARLSTQVMQLVESVKKSSEFGFLIEKFCWLKLGSGKSRTGLKEAAAIVLSVIQMSSDCITTSYALNGPRMVATEVNAADIERVHSFLRWYFVIIERAIPNVSKPKRAIFNKIPATLGCMLFSWIQSGRVGGSTDDEMWVKFVKANHDHKNFLDTLFARLTKGNRQNATTSDFNAKITAIVSAFAQTRSFENVIAEITGVEAPTVVRGAVINNDSGSETETDYDSDEEDFE